MARFRYLKGETLFMAGHVEVASRSFAQALALGREMPALEMSEGRTVGGTEVKKQRTEFNEARTDMMDNAKMRQFSGELIRFVFLFILYSKHILQSSCPKTYRNVVFKAR